jgi:signal transduction histidine kinase/CHASE3 domain sensor protein
MRAINRLEGRTRKGIPFGMHARGFAVPDSDGESAHNDPATTEETLRERRRTVADAWARSAPLAPLSLVVIALLGSVLIPARQTWLITTLLRETTEVVAPARLLETQLQSGLAEEIGALQGYALSGDTTLLLRYRSVAENDDEKLEKLEGLAVGLDTAFAGHLTAVRRRIDDWRRFSAALVEGRGAHLEFGAAVRTGQSRYDASLAAIANLSSDLFAEASARDNRLRELEHFSLTSNAALVLAALAALTAVLILTLRERRLAAALRRRVEAESARARQEGALREAAEALSGAFSVEEVTQRIAHAALDAVEGRGAFVEQIGTRPNESSNILTVEAVAGTGVPPLGSSCDFAGSYVERVLRSGAPALIPAPGEPAYGGMLTVGNGAAGSAIAVPIVSRGTPIGALFVLSARGHFRANDVTRAGMFGHLATLAYERVELLAEAIEARERLQRAISSRSRLIRGFSHDVKNPIGAADGYAELLIDGIYGDLNPQQCESISRMRRCMHDALSLIDDLHELGRAETGHLALSPEPLDLAGLVRGISEEYQATANASGLAFAVDIAADLPIVQTSRTRVRQIVANLLSNAFKYTDAGSVTIRSLRRSLGPVGDIGDWVIVEVSDTGRGIPQDKLDFIFQEFGRIGGTNKSGAGLGLAISRLLAQALGGQISVTSELGRGSTFTLWLPTMMRHQQDR